MSNTLESLQRQIKSSGELASIVRTMKALAATSVAQYERAVESLDDYYRTVEKGLSVVLASRQQQLMSEVTKGTTLLVIFGSDHGLVGRFNEQIATYALEDYWLQQEGRELPDDIMIACLGEQVFTRISERGHYISGKFTMPISINAITPAVQSLLETIEAWQENAGVDRVLLLYNRPALKASFESYGGTLVPVDLLKLAQQQAEWQSRSLPTFTLPPEQLLSALLRQYFFVSLYRAFAFSLAAENASRLAAMQAAEKNIKERLEELSSQYQQARQTAITEELLDIISGFKALRKKEEFLSEEEVM